MGMQQTERGALLPLILETAIRCFEEGGLEALSMRRVAKQMGYTATTLYRYVENKEALIFALVEEGFARFRVALHAAMSAHQEVRTRLWALGRAYLDFAVHEPVYYRLMFMERCDLTMRGLDPEQDAPIRSFSMLQQTIEDAMAQRVLKPGDALCTAHLFWSFVHGLASLYIATPKGSFPAPIEMLYAQGMNHLMDGLAERRP